jgi:hypothetical protein
MFSAFYENVAGNIGFFTVAKEKVFVLPYKALRLQGAWLTNSPANYAIHYFFLLLACEYFSSGTSWIFCGLDKQCLLSDKESFGGCAKKIMGKLKKIFPSSGKKALKQGKWH